MSVEFDAVTNLDDYTRLYQESIADPDAFWAKQAHRLHWDKAFTTVSHYSWDTAKIDIRWFADGELNVCYNCVDRHAEQQPNKTALIWEGNDPNQSLVISYQQLKEHVCRFSHALEQLGLKPGDRVILYMPMIVEATYAMLACARLGLVHSVVFGGFSARSLAGRIIDCGARTIITADVAIRGDRILPLKQWVEEALDIVDQSEHDNTVEKTIVVDNTLQKDIAQADQACVLKDNQLDYQALVKDQNAHHDAKAFAAEHPLFILYTSGSTGKPKGLVHTTGGYLCYAETTHRYIFDYREDDIYFCTADVGWITGHSYLVYGPLACGSTSVMFGGVPTWPDMGRFGQIIDKHKITVFYTSPTAIRTLLAQESTALKGSSRQSLRLLGSVGEPINPDVWNWYHNSFGQGRCPIVDTWWQTETGGILITALQGTGLQKPGSASRPFFGIVPAIVDEKHQEVPTNTNGELVVKASWPGQARDIWNDHALFIATYYARHPNMYFSGDGGRCDEEGDFWITGRIDDVLNVSGHRIGSAEVENAAVEHKAVAEAAVVGCPHPIKGEAIYLYVVATENYQDTQNSDEVRQHVRSVLGPIATPEYIHWTPDLPKTRSGKIMRRILRKIASGQTQDLGDITTLADHTIVDKLIAGAQKTT